MADYQLRRQAGFWQGSFMAMASPCEILLDTDDQLLAERLVAIGCQEAKRIEQKFSRYRSDSVVAALNGSHGKIVSVDQETEGLLRFADQCYQISGGLFDITSGVLRKVWKFDGSSNLPTDEQVREILVHIGWDKVHWGQQEFSMPEGMEIDFGGIGKEYAVDRVLGTIRRQAAVPVLVNFGGDLAASGYRTDGSAWRIGIERPDQDRVAAGILEISSGALATSGDAKRYLLRDGVRYGHILNPRTGWPVTGAPRSVTVAAGTCIEAGMLATFSMLHGAEAESFLKGQGAKAWIVR